MKIKDKVLVMLSTYNGEKYLGQLLESVEKQQKVNFDIFIRDDGSQDKTSVVLEKYKNRFSNIKVVYGTNKGYAQSFWSILRKCNEYKFYAFCDQDDYWEPEKLYQAVNAISQYPETTPVLYTSRVVSVDNQMNTISENAFDTTGTQNVYQSFQRSIVPGCVFVFNHKAWEYLHLYKGYVESHDRAAYAIINTFGRVIYDSHSYIKYRVYEGNTIGVQTKWNKTLKRILNFFKPSLCTRSRFAKDFYLTYKSIIPSKELAREIYNLGFYRENRKAKFALLRSNKFKGIVFKFYVVLNRV